MSREATVEAVGETRDGDAPVVLLAAEDDLVPILVSPDQAHAIQLALDGEAFDRPLTHDVLVEAIAEFGGAVDRVRVDEIHDATFLAKLETERYHGGERSRAVFDVRASDAIAIALRADCPILLSEHVLDRAGRSPDERPDVD